MRSGSHRIVLECFVNFFFNFLFHFLYQLQHVNCRCVGTGSCKKFQPISVKLLHIKHLVSVYWCWRIRFQVPAPTSSPLPFPSARSARWRLTRNSLDRTVCHTPQKTDSRGKCTRTFLSKFCWTPPRCKLKSSLVNLHLTNLTSWYLTIDILATELYTFFPRVEVGWEVFGDKWV